MKLLLVEWMDANGVNRDWEDLDNYTALLPTMRSVGWVVHETETLLCVCPHYCEKTGDIGHQGCGIMTIPKVAIVSRKELVGIVQ